MEDENQFWTVQERIAEDYPWVLMRQAYTTEAEADDRAAKLKEQFPSYEYKVRPILVKR